MAVRVKDLTDDSLDFRLELLTPEISLNIKLNRAEINRPGLALAGFVDHFANERIQIFGNGEWALLNSLSEEKLENALKTYFSYYMPALVYTHWHEPPAMLLKFAREKNVPVFRTQHTTNRFIQLYSDYLDKKTAPKTTMHGVLVEVFGVGILLIGKSGVGKSETALELVERGHRLVADDIVEIICLGGQRLYGYVSDVIEHHMEIRGLGIINIKDLFGAGSVRKSKRIDMVVQIEDWQKDHEYDRLGLDNPTYEILGVQVSLMTIPVRPGRNVPILVETAAKNLRLKQMGVHAARAFNERLMHITTKRMAEEEE